MSIDYEAFREWAFSFDAFEMAVVRDPVWGWLTPLLAVSIYVTIVHLVPPLITKGWNLRWPLMVWNLTLSVGSGLVFVAWVGPFYEYYLEHGFAGTLCMADQKLWGPGTWVPFCCFLFAWSKYAEMIDTVFLILRKRPVIFLHYYHHASALWFCWVSLQALFVVGNIMAIMNAFVHTIMYFYFFLAAAGFRMSWGKYITKMQISQMVAALVFTSLWVYLWATGHDCPLHPMRSPAFVIATSLGVYGSYFVLFVRFNRQRLAARRDASSKKSKSS